jgi:glutamyl/glutaminyl-tRNA synthetase
MIRSRIAPTPSGYLHIGNALNFVLTWLWVRSKGGILRLRIDDIDALRAKPEYIDDIFRTLDWLGMDWDEGPQTSDEQQRIYSQSLRAERYNELIQLLIKRGNVFACQCSRKDLNDQSCNCLTKNTPLDKPDTALRIITPSKPIEVNDIKAGLLHIDLNKEMKDFVIRRRDGIAAYQIASLADDLDCKTNLIVRGEDLLSSTAAQLYLASLIDEIAFSTITFYHHPLLKNEEGHKLSKSAGSSSLKTMRESNTSCEDFYIRLSGIMGWQRKCSSLQEMLESLEAEKIFTYFTP